MEQYDFARRFVRGPTILADHLSTLQSPDSEDEESLANEQIGLEAAAFYSEVAKLSEPPAAVEEVYFCDICDEKVASSRREEHQQSVLHQYNTDNVVAKPPVYFIPQSNVGHRILKEKLGWKGFGLGPEGSGKIEPIKTRVKNDRLGIGAPQKNPLTVTHTTAERGKHGRSTYRSDFDPDERAKKVHTKPMSRIREREVKEERRRAAEIRRQVYSDPTPFDELLAYQPRSR